MFRKAISSSKGDNLISGGSPNPHDILEVMGVEALAEYPRERKSRRSTGSRA